MKHAGVCPGAAPSPGGGGDVAGVAGIIIIFM